MKTSFLVILLAAALLSGCATDKGSSAAAGFVPATCPPDKALVYLYRAGPSIGRQNGIMMCVNYIPSAYLHGYQYCPLVLDPAGTQFGHQYDAEIGSYGSMLISKNVVDLRLRLEAGKIYYIAYRYWLNPFHYPNPTMVLVDTDTGIRELSTCAATKAINPPQRL
jgi:hypothetical protein